jgi:hypothetical protein
MVDTVCSVKNCRKSVDIISCGKPLCWDHWKKYCEETE